MHIATFDIVVLLECKSVQDARLLRETLELDNMAKLLVHSSKYTEVMAYENVARFDDVSKDANGIFLLNNIYSEDTQMLLDVWKYTAGWWTEKANLTNSTVLKPLAAGASYNLINHCRWNKLIDVLPSFKFKPSMKSFVLKNFTENNIVTMPILYKLA